MLQCAKSVKIGNKGHEQKMNAMIKILGAATVAVTAVAGTWADVAKSSSDVQGGTWKIVYSSAALARRGQRV